MSRWLLGGLFALLLIAGYAVPLAMTLHQAALAAQPGDRLVVVFPPGISAPEALSQLGGSGTMLAGIAGMPWFYTTEIVDPAAAIRLGARGWIMRLPSEGQSFAGCFVPPSTQESRPRGW